MSNFTSKAIAKRKQEELKNYEFYEKYKNDSILAYIEQLKRKSKLKTKKKNGKKLNKKQIALLEKMYNFNTKKTSKSQPEETTFKMFDLYNNK